MVQPERTEAQPPQQQEAAQVESAGQIFKYVVVGDACGGKSTLLHRFTTGQFSDEYTPTIGVDFSIKIQKLPSGDSVKLQLWDTAGQERFRQITTAYYRGAHAVFIVYDVTSKRSYDSVSYWIKEADKYAGEDVLVSVVGLKGDLKDKGEYYGVSQLKAEAEIKSADIDGFFEVSAKTGEGVDTVFQAVTEILVDRRRSQNSTSLSRGAARFKSGEDGNESSRTVNEGGREGNDSAKKTEKEKKEEEEEEEEEEKEKEKKAGAAMTATLLLLGNEAVGKTQLLQCFRGEAFSDVSSTTIGVDFATKNLVLPNRDVVKVMVWDTAGKERFRNIARSYYRGANGFVIVYDVTDENSYNVRQWLKEVKINKGDDAVVVVVGTKVDLRGPHSDKRLPSTEKLQRELKDEGVHGFFEASAKTGEGVDSVFRAVTELVVEKRLGETVTVDSAKGSEPVHETTTSRSNRGNEHLEGTTTSKSQKGDEPGETTNSKSGQAKELPKTGQGDSETEKENTSKSQCCIVL